MSSSSSSVSTLQAPLRFPSASSGCTDGDPVSHPASPNPDSNGNHGVFNLSDRAAGHSHLRRAKRTLRAKGLTDPPPENREAWLPPEMGHNRESPGRSPLMNSQGIRAGTGPRREAE